MLASKENKLTEKALQIKNKEKLLEKREKS